MTAAALLSYGRSRGMSPRHGTRRRHRARKRGEPFVEADAASTVAASLLVSRSQTGAPSSGRGGDAQRAPEREAVTRAVGGQPRRTEPGGSEA